MKKLFIAGVLVLFSLFGYGQIKTVYFDAKDQVIADSVKAASYAIYGKISGDSLWIFKKYDLDGYLTATGSFKDDSLKVPDGKFIYYDWIDPNKSVVGYDAVSAGRDRYVVITGDFKDGFRQGVWRSFYENGRTKSRYTFNKGLMDGPYQSFSTNGDLEEKGQYVNDKKSGEWISDGGLKVTVYQDGQVISTIRKSRKELRAEQEQKKNN